MKFFEFIQKALSESDGNPSSVRVNAFTVITQFSFVMTVGFAWVVYKNPELILAYTGMLLTTILGILGIKVYQKDKEGTNGTDPK